MTTTRTANDVSWLVELAISPDVSQRVFAAGHPATPSGFLRRLALDRDPQVVIAVKGNPSRPVPLEVRRISPESLRRLPLDEVAGLICGTTVSAPCSHCPSLAVVLQSRGFSCIEHCPHIERGAPGPLAWRGHSGRWHRVGPGDTDGVSPSRWIRPEPAPECVCVEIDAAAR